MTVSPQHVEDHAPSAGEDDDFGRRLARNVRHRRNLTLAYLGGVALYIALALWRPHLYNKFYVGLYAGLLLSIGLSIGSRYWSDRWMLRTRNDNRKHGRAASWDRDFVAGAVTAVAAADPHMPNAAAWMRHVYAKHGYDADRRAFELRTIEVDGRRLALEGTGTYAEGRDREAQRANVMIAKACHAEALAAWTAGASGVEVVHEEENEENEA